MIARYSEHTLGAKRICAEEQSCNVSHADD